MTTEVQAPAVPGGEADRLRGTTPPQVHQKQSRELLCGFAGVLVLLFGSLTAGEVNLRNVQASTELVKLTLQFELAIQRLFQTAMDIEAGAHQLARTTIVEDLEQVRRLSGDGPDQQADLRRITAGVHVRLQELAKRVANPEQSRPGTARTTDPAPGQQIVGELRDTVARMTAREDALLGGRLAASTASFRMARLSGFLSTGLTTAALAALLVIVLREEAERRRLVRTAVLEKAQLRGMLQQKNDFVAIVSHELRTPTNAIAGRVQMLEQHGVDGEQAAEAVAAIARNARALRQLIDDLMDTTQLAAGRMRLTIGPVDWGVVVRNAVDAVRSTAESRNVRLTHELGPDLPVLVGDAGRLEQVLWNLLGNGIKFTPSGGHVHLAVKSGQDSIRIEVGDTGQGITPSFLPHVFDRFRQEQSAATHGGIGLGLAIVRHIVELHGGEVTAESPGVGQGATFAVTLPTNASGLATAGAGAGMFERQPGA